jgi:hypothetical protein
MRGLRAAWWIGVVRRVVLLVPALCALTGFTAVSAGGAILFAADADVPPTVRAFAWRVIETRCNFQRHELGQHWFWAHDARTSTVDGGAVYSIKIVSELPWRKTDPPAILEMVLADDGRGLRLTALDSAFITCMRGGA